MCDYSLHYVTNRPLRLADAATVSSKRRVGPETQHPNNSNDPCSGTMHHRRVARNQGPPSRVRQLSAGQASPPTTILLWGRPVLKESQCPHPGALSRAIWRSGRQHARFTLRFKRGHRKYSGHSLIGSLPFDRIAESGLNAVLRRLRFLISEIGPFEARCGSGHSRRFKDVERRSASPLRTVSLEADRFF
jgi:hypothetical protein